MADFRPGVGTANLLTRVTEARVTLSDGARLRARLVIAADGRNSAVREAAGIGVRTLRYGQKALAFAVTHPIPHDNVSTEIHRSGGPFTLVPLPDFTGADGIRAPLFRRGLDGTRARGAAAAGARHARIRGRDDGAVSPISSARSRWSRGSRSGRS